MIIYDKAAWQIDGGIEPRKVIDHFSFVFNWLKQHNMLSEDGLEILDFGIDIEVSLNEKSVTKNGADFLNLYYDNIIEQSKYEISFESELFDSSYSQFAKLYNNHD